MRPELRKKDSIIIHLHICKADQADQAQSSPHHQCYALNEMVPQERLKFLRWMRRKRVPDTGPSRSSKVEITQRVRILSRYQMRIYSERLPTQWRCRRRLDEDSIFANSIEDAISQDRVAMSTCCTAWWLQIQNASKS